jgi:hypothetical protein
MRVTFARPSTLTYSRTKPRPARRVVRRHPVATPKARVIRVHDAAWDGSKARAEKEGRSLADVLNEFLESYAGVESERRRPRALASAQE